ncbi:hypothetical protein JHK87_039949 [Glycine soja]|nr:hypothetical protein JHK87_039949 [Glycine soja]
MLAPAILIPILVATADTDAIVSSGVPKGLPVGIDSVGDLGELVQHGVLAVAFGAGTAVVGGGRGEAAIGGLRWEREKQGRPLCGERNGKLLASGRRWNMRLGTWL